MNKRKAICRLHLQLIRLYEDILNLVSLSNPAKNWIYLDMNLSKMAAVSAQIDSIKAKKESEE